MDGLCEPLYALETLKLDPWMEYTQCTWRFSLHFVLAIISRPYMLWDISSDGQRFLSYYRICSWMHMPYKKSKLILLCAQCAISPENKGSWIISFLDKVRARRRRAFHATLAFHVNSSKQRSNYVGTTKEHNNDLIAQALASLRHVLPRCICFLFSAKSSLHRVSKSCRVLMMRRRRCQSQNSFA